jgi:hypothetical protein
MGFAANPEGGIWKLTWNRDAVTALNPSSASLSIRDGANQQQIPLTAAELGAGMVFYTPQSGDLVFGLKLLLPGAPPEEEEVRVLQPMSVPQTASVQIMTTGHGIRTVRGPMPPPQSQRQPGHDLVEPAIPPPILPENKMPATKEIPALVGLPVSIPPAHITVPYVPSPVPENLAIAPATSAAEPKPSGITAASYVPPKSVRQVTANLPMGVVVGEPVEIQVKVEINAAGKVTKATPLRVKAMNYALVGPAVRAAESWAFDPALENGRPVPSQMIVTFRFVSK